MCTAREERKTALDRASSSSVEKLRRIHDGNSRRCACSENLQGAIATMWKENVNVGQLDENESTTSVSHFRTQRWTQTKYLLMQSRIALTNDHTDRSSRANVAVAIVHCWQVMRPDLNEVTLLLLPPLPIFFQCTNVIDQWNRALSASILRAIRLAENRSH